ncbi:unnamed protein product [Polarella glacialis]|uniref:Uncharacterized protein n=1 Tax=Polarella glacialis TaxID=89957 RepID=A0A813GU27_POLGL|nr:unnamed protein product [Polarella glacialis]
MAQEASDVVAARLYLALLGCFLLCYMCYLLVQCRRSNLRRFWGNMFKNFQRICKSRGEERHKQQIHRQRIRWATRFAECLLHMAAVKHLSGLVAVLIEQDTEVLDFVLSILTRDYMAIFLFFIVILSPTRFVVKILDASQLLFSAWLIYISVASPTREISTGHLLVRIVSGLVTGNAWISCPCQLAILIFSCVFSTGDKQARFEDLWIEIWSSGIIVTALIVYEMVIRRWVIDTVPAVSEATQRRLLCALCDAVVTLGPNLHISESAKKLANLLGQLQDYRDAGRSPSLEGSHFLDFIVDTDKLRFLRFVDRSALDWQAGPGSEPAPAEALNVQLTSGGPGVSHQVQLFHSRFLDPDGKVSHLIGIIREAGPPPICGDQSEYAAARLHRGTIARSRSFEESSDPSGLTDSISVVEARKKLERHDGQGLDEKEEQQDAEEEQDSITPLRRKAQDVTVAFQQLKFIVKDNRKGVKPVVTASLLHHEELLKWATQWASTKDWMQDFVNAAVRPLNPTSWPSDAGEPSSLSFQVAFSGTCSLPPDLLTRAAEESSFGTAGSLNPSHRVARRLEIGRMKLRLRSSSQQVLGFRSEEKQQQIQQLHQQQQPQQQQQQGSGQYHLARAEEGTSRRQEQAPSPATSSRQGFRRYQSEAFTYNESPPAGARQSRGPISL